MVPAGFYAAPTGRLLNRALRKLVPTDCFPALDVPHGRWQRGTNELLRQHFQKGTHLSAHGPDDLAAVAAALNGRPRKTPGWRTLAEALDAVLRTTG